jgi:hypothetical protein
MPCKFGDSPNTAVTAVGVGVIAHTISHQSGNMLCACCRTPHNQSRARARAKTARAGNSLNTLRKAQPERDSLAPRTQ